MSIFHYKASFVKQKDNEGFYDFYPDYFSFENVKGEFKINSDSWETDLISKVELENRNSQQCNNRPVAALAYKIRKHFEENNEFPKEVFHIA
jgi:hypothetical protein